MTRYLTCGERFAWVGVLIATATALFALIQLWRTL